MLNKLRNQELCGIVSMFVNICDLLPQSNPEDLKKKVMRFFTRYFRNRHKSTILTPGVHLTGNSIDDNRFDHRPYQYDNRGERPYNYQWLRVDSICEYRLKEFNKGKLI